MDTGCAASLTAFHSAIQDLRNGLCDEAIVGGTQLCLKPQTCLLYYRAGVLSDDGITRAYDHKGETTDIYTAKTVVLTGHLHRGPHQAFYTGVKFLVLAQHPVVLVNTFGCYFNTLWCYDYTLGCNVNT